MTNSNTPWYDYALNVNVVNVPVAVISHSLRTNTRFFLSNVFLYPSHFIGTNIGILLCPHEKSLALCAHIATHLLSNRRQPLRGYWYKAVGANILHPGCGCIRVHSVGLRGRGRLNREIIKLLEIDTLAHLETRVDAPVLQVRVSC